MICTDSKYSEKQKILFQFQVINVAVQVSTQVDLIVMRGYVHVSFECHVVHGVGLSFESQTDFTTP